MLTKIKKTERERERESLLLAILPLINDQYLPAH